MAKAKCFSCGVEEGDYVYRYPDKQYFYWTQSRKKAAGWWGMDEEKKEPPGVRVVLREVNGETRCQHCAAPFGASERRRRAAVEREKELESLGQMRLFDA